jgi:DNA repair ATPase RecN
VEYLRNVAHGSSAAASVEAGVFEPEALAEVAERHDGLGQLARVFQRMVREVQAREQRLRQQVQELKIEIDEVKKARQVAEITETDYFQELQEKARKLRSRERQP